MDQQQLKDGVSAAAMAAMLSPPVGRESYLQGIIEKSRDGLLRFPSETASAVDRAPIPDGIARALR